MKIAREWSFGDDRDLVDVLKRLVLSGTKTATTGLYHDTDSIPMIGDYEAILDTDEKRFCIIRCTHAEVKPFLDVGIDFIQKEGEGDETIEAWREKHRRFFNLTSDNVKVICEEFELISVL